MRLDRFVSYAIGISRSSAHELIKNHHVKVNYVVCMKINQVIDEKNDCVMIDEKVLVYQQYHYVMLNKPAGLISATCDDYHQTILDIIDYPVPLVPIGRLDKDTEGLVILSNNGSLVHYLTSPKSNIWKTYYVRTRDILTKDYIRAFEQGFDLCDGKKVPYHSLPAHIDMVSSNEALVHLAEGKFHQVKKMFIVMENEVVYLKRMTIGPIQLDLTLEVGAYRPLNEDEIHQLLSLKSKEV